MVYLSSFIWIYDYFIGEITGSKLAGFQWQIAENKTQTGLTIKGYCCYTEIRILEVGQILGWFDDIVRDPFLICQQQSQLSPRPTSLVVIG